jgi:hypothetical protein
MTIVGDVAQKFNISKNLPKTARLIDPPHQTQYQANPAQQKRPQADARGT